MVNSNISGLVAPDLIASPIDGASDRSRLLVQPQVKNRIGAIDFAKGGLVLTMVFYHWMNYFLRVDGDVYKYLRFLTPSFIFITGFLVSQVYFRRSCGFDFKTARRLFRRGSKLLVIVLLLNLAASFVHVKSTEVVSASGLSYHFALGFIAGTVPIVFSILVPIAYLLILSAVLWQVSGVRQTIIHLTAALLVLAALICEVEHFQSGYLQLVSIGMLGVSMGYTAIASIHAVLRRSLPIFVAYICYLFAITLWNVRYPLQIVGVCLSVAILYWLGGKIRENSIVHRVVSRLGRYSLFAYIAQIVILNILEKGFRQLGSGAGAQAAALLSGAALTILSVEAVDRARQRASGFNRLYSAVFS